ncbi:uncharacterized protein [Amphiura filiformis]|uniref:uncharacterized protein n=1 Tax=Amphiura filiformis TaxID=82378 RepID=UPI003B20DA32
MAGSREKKTLKEMIPEINESIKYLQNCKDFSTKEAHQHFSLIGFTRNKSPCDDTIGLRKHIGNSDFGSLFPKMWDALSTYLDEDIIWEAQGLKNFEIMLQTFGNVADSSPELGASLGKCGGIPLLLACLDQLKDKQDHDTDQIIFYITRNIFMLLHNAIRLWPSNLTYFREGDAVPILKGFFDLDKLWQIHSLMIVAYVATDAEKKELEMGVRVLINILKEAVGTPAHSGKVENTYFSAFEVLNAINLLAINDDIKKSINKEKAIPFIIKMLKEDFSSEEQKAAADALWNLAFIDKIRQSGILQDTIPTLKKLAKSTNKELRDACASALFEIQGDRIETNGSSTGNSSHTPLRLPPSYQKAISEPDPSSSKQSGQIMISYQWDSQERVKQIKDRLVAGGYRVWLDLDNMHDDILECMALAVEKSDVILMCMTERYKNSKNCRSEASYAYKRTTKVIPLLFQEGYMPDGWLGLLLGTKLYYKFYSDDHINENIEQLLKAIAGDDAKAGIGEEIDGHIDHSLQEEQSPKATPTKLGEPTVRDWDEEPTAGDWDKEKVQRWLKGNYMAELCDSCKGFDGRHLQEMYLSLRRNKEKFKDELKLDYFLSIKIVVALEDAFGK